MTKGHNKISKDIFGRVEELAVCWRERETQAMKWLDYPPLTRYDMRNTTTYNNNMYTVY